MGKYSKKGRQRFPCLSLIGMPGAGKSTVGVRLARALGWAFIDSDNLIEAIYGARLQDITDALGKEAFLDAESKVILSIKAGRCVIATGGSVVYRRKAMDHLARLGPIIHLSLSLPKIEERIALRPDRGLAIGPGQTLADIYAERKTLYSKACDIACEAETKTPDECVSWIMERLPADCLKSGEPSHLSNCL